jgi:hypothetical protein
VPLPENEDWVRAVQRLSVPARIAEISDETYFEFLDVLPPKLVRGSLFAFAEVQEPLRVFLRRGGKNNLVASSPRKRPTACAS